MIDGKHWYWLAPFLALCLFLIILLSWLLYREFRQRKQPYRTVTESGHLSTSTCSENTHCIPLEILSGDDLYSNSFERSSPPNQSQQSWDTDRNNPQMLAPSQMPILHRNFPSDSLKLPRLPSDSSDGSRTPFLPPNQSFNQQVVSSWDTHGNAVALPTDLPSVSTSTGMPRNQVSDEIMGISSDLSTTSRYLTPIGSTSSYESAVN